jgi:hypothetical protein
VGGDSSAKFPHEILMDIAFEVMAAIQCHTPAGYHTFLLMQYLLLQISRVYFHSELVSKFDLPEQIAHQFLTLD